MKLHFGGNMTHAARLGTKLTAPFQYRWLASILLIILLDICTWMAFKPTSGKMHFDFEDKILHAFAFCVLCVVGHIALHFDIFKNSKPMAFRVFLVNWVLWISYGVFIEVVQSLLSYRAASMGDLYADIVGIMIGTLIVIAFRLHPRPKN